MYINYKHCIVVAFSILIFANSQAQSVANWQPVGPIAFPTSQSSQINGIGRVVTMKYDPVTANKAYAVTVNSAFVTTDNANTWNVLPGINNMPSSACASICIDYTNPSILYLGTGDPNYNSTSKASGVWKSTDGGNTFILSNSGMGNKLVFDIIMSPADHNVLVAATNSGIYKSINGGASWVQKSTVTDALSIAQNTAANSPILYFVKAAAGATGLFYTSTDFGDTWAPNSSFTTPILTYRGARVATTPANPNVVYLSFLGKGGGGPGFVSSGGGIVYKSIDGGANFTMQKDDILPNLIGYKSTEGGQGNYNFDFAISPTDENTVFTIGHLVWKSTDAGVTWVQMQTSWSVEIHTDMHKLIFNPNNTTEIFNCNDGGVWKSIDGGDTWVPKCQNLAATEFYHFANSHFSKNVIGAGAQDNGEIYFKNGTWYTNRGGDWTSTYYFDENSALPGKAVYCRNGSTRDIINAPTSTEKTYNLPFAPQNSDNYTFSIQNANIAFVQHNLNTAETNVAGIYKTTNLQNLTAGNPTWTKIFTQADAASIMMTTEANPTNADTVYVVLQNLDVYRCDNALSAAPVFSLIKAGTDLSTQFTLPASISAADLEVLKNGVLFLSLNGKVIKSTDMGVTWSDYKGITASSFVALPSTTNFIEIIQDSTQNNESLYAMSVNSVYYRNNTMTGWMLFMNNLPTTPNFTDIDIYNNPLNSNDNKLRLSTYGRGLWETTPSSISVVPLKFLGLKADVRDNINRLLWQTAFEINTLAFEIESSADGLSFQKIGVVQAAINSNATKSYLFNDYMALPNTTTYYRIKMIDADGKFEYSNIVYLKSKAFSENTMIVLNNPISNYDFNLLMRVSTSQTAKIIITDVLGKQIGNQTVKLNQGSQIIAAQQKISLAGVYFIKAMLQNGIILTQRLVKK